jgi:lipopolysaccharide biosynthesis regulator YciM
MPLDECDQRHLERAQGYAALGMFLEANEELEEIKPDVRCVPKVLIIRMAIYQGTARWSAMAVVANRLVEFDPSEPAYFINLAYALRRSESLDAAHAILQRAEDLHPESAHVQLNLACYEAQLGNIEDAERHLGRAISKDPRFRRLALEDPDLEPLWHQIRSIE